MQVKQNLSKFGAKKIVVLGTNGKLGREIACQLLCHNASELHFTFSSNRSLNDFKDFIKKYKIKKSFSEHIINISDEDNIPKSLLDDSIVIISTSSMPVFKKLLLIIFFIKVFIRKILGKDVHEILGDAPVFYKEKNTPKEIDWLGQKNIIDKAKNAKHIILVSSMLGSYTGAFLNKCGNESNALLWKRKSEIYLNNSNIPYTIIHPPHLTNRKASLKLRDFLLEVNDLRDRIAPKVNSSIPPEFLIFNFSLARSDLAYFIKECVEHLNLVNNKSFDLIKRKDIKVSPLSTDNFSALILELGNKEYDYSNPKHPILNNF